MSRLRCSGYKAGFDTGFKEGYLKGKLTYWVYLVLGYYAEQGVVVGTFPLPQCYLEALKLLKKLDKPTADIPAYAVQAQTNHTTALKNALDVALAAV